MPDNTPSPEANDQTVDDYTYVGIIPKLGPGKEGDMYPSLLPIYGGQPGLEYLQCPVTNQKEWQSAGWKSVRNTHVYTIKGPLGSVDCQLLVIGERLHTSDHQSNKRVLWLDPEIERITGLNHFNGVEELPESEQPKPEGESVDAESRTQGESPQKAETQVQA